MDIIKVWLARADLLPLLKHPTGAGFQNLDDPVGWPADQFTYRRLRDGDITDKPPIKKPSAKPAP